MGAVQASGVVPRLEHIRLVRHTLPEDLEEVQLIALGDIHAGHENFSGETFFAVLEWLKAANNRYAVLAGDAFEMAVRNSKGNPHRSLSPSDEKRYLLKHLEPVREKLLAAIDGNHEERMRREMDMSPMEDLAQHLGIPYAQSAVSMILRFGKKPKNAKPMVYRGFITHGWAGGRMPGSALNAAMQLAFVQDADFYMVGHSHQVIGHKFEHLRVDEYNKRLTMRQIAVVSSGSCLGYAAYAANKGMRPTAIGYPVLTLSGKRFQMEVAL